MGSGNPIHLGSVGFLIEPLVGVLKNQNNNLNTNKL